MIGTYEDAILAINGELETFGYGSSRRTYLVGDVVYKVNRHSGWDANEEEWNKYLKVREMVRDDAVISVPETHLFSLSSGNVIAMRYIEGQEMSQCSCVEGENHDRTCLPKSMAAPIMRYIEDLGGDNIIFDGERYWIIDLGEV